MKKQLLLFIMMLLPMVASADDSGSCGDNVTYSFNEATNTLTISGTGAMKDFPSFYYQPWYSYRDKIFYVIIKSGVTTIGDDAFTSCSGLTSVTIPNSVTSIGLYAFSECSGLTSVTIPNSVTSIGAGVFSHCSGLTSVTIPNSVTSIDVFAFTDCTGLTSVHITDLEAWCKIAFDDNSANPLYYAHHLFLNGEEIKDLVIPNSVTSIGKSAFSGCSGLTSVTIPNSVTGIGQWAFYGCSGLTSIVVNSGNTVYDSREECNALIKTSDNELITGCMNTTIPNSVTSIGQSAFSECSGLTSVTIPNSVTSIGYDAFLGCSGLTSVTIPNSVTRINEGVFSGCSGLTSVTIPNSVRYIGFFAFSNCSGLTSVTIPDSVITIDQAAFSYCSGLTSVTISNSVEIISNYAFYGCNSLTSVTIGSSVNRIQTYAFGKCEKMETVYCLARNVPNTNADAFQDSHVEHTTLYVPNTSLYSYKAMEPWRQFGTFKTLGDTKIETKKYVMPIIKSNGGQLTVEGAEDGTQVRVYGVNGVEVGSGISRNGLATVSTNLKPGSVAIIKIGNRSVKITQ